METNDEGETRYGKKRGEDKEGKTEECDAGGDAGQEYECRGVRLQAGGRAADGFGRSWQPGRLTLLSLAGWQVKMLRFACRFLASEVGVATASRLASRLASWVGWDLDGAMGSGRAAPGKQGGAGLRQWSLLHEARWTWVGVLVN